MINTRDMAKAMREELTFSKEEIEELMRAKAMPVTFDRDCPETTPERALKFKRVNPPRQAKILADTI